MISFYGLLKKRTWYWWVLLLSGLLMILSVTYFAARPGERGYSHRTRAQLAGNIHLLEAFRKECLRFAAANGNSLPESKIQLDAQNPPLKNDLVHMAPDFSEIIFLAPGAALQNDKDADNRFIACMITDDIYRARRIVQFIALNGEVFENVVVPAVSK